ncbi:preprotein translocase subunit SecA [Occallatibacter riparius]|uniref:Protein translocase subunit SecA n=1 Tax=Occallatibacter riparius TaxID=1002689 RepID=A0A9J7BJZ2_9BACT|nr:preprotein translocase subunit SecA [Occallatibacter riparius]UWZ82983.1 preprotein translocase subunit SecA [Occallatibacter riparius]
MFFDKAFTKVFGTANERVIKKLIPIVNSINALEPATKELSDEQLKAKTAEFKTRIAQRLEGLTDPDAIKQAERAALDEILPEAFAVVREAGWRTVKMRHFDVQLIGGMVLHHGKISEMKTGEGKTLVATLACYLNALAGRGVHVVTVNDYLAKRDAEWMGKIYEFLGLTVGVIVHDLSDDERRAAYGADITYGTNNEFGFDYLRDNMKFDIKDCVQRGHYYSIVDEVDSILIDEARTPLIISGPTDQTTDKYQRVKGIIPKLVKGEETETLEGKTFTGDYVVDEKHRTIGVTDEGWVSIERELNIDNIADAENWDLKHFVETAIKAHALYKRDVDYVVKDGEVIIVDTFTGRLMPGRRWSDGLHQSIEAKEGVQVRKEDQTLATITFQNYFRLYQKLSGMTGTAETEAAEFEKIYKLEIVVIPTNKPLLRVENSDVVYRTEKEKYTAVADNIAELYEKKQPALVGTTSIEKSERLSAILQRKGVPHVVLNAKFHEREAEIVAQAGKLGRVTIATNMAGRGTDILLGGNADFMTRQQLVKQNNARALSAGEGKINPMAPAGFLRFYYQGQEFEVSETDWAEVNKIHAEAAAQEHAQVIEAGGLFILGTERHESRRIDNQLRGRAGRQGDPGASRFFLSLEDDLMRIFAKQWVSTLLERLGMEEGVPIESRMISNRIEAAQKAVESQNFESRKHVLEYDDVMNKQREAVYGLRRQLLEGVDQRELILEDYVGGILSSSLDEFAPEDKHADQWNIKGLQEKLMGQFGVSLEAAGIKPLELARHELGDEIFERLKQEYEAKENILGAPTMRYHERMVMLSVMDGLWKDHLLSMDHLKEGIGLRGYAQRDPLVEYKRESFDMFEAMMLKFQEDTVRFLFRMQIIGPDGQPVNAAPQPRREVPAAPPVASAARPAPGDGHRAPVLEAPREIPVPTRAPQTTIDQLEKEFAKKKQRELAHASMAGGSAASQPSQRRTGDKVGRNDPCPCGSGKKYKKCHGTEA